MNELPKVPIPLGRPDVHPLPALQGAQAALLGDPREGGSPTGEAPHSSPDSPGTGRSLKRIPRSNLKAMTVKFLREQGGLCPLCGKPIDLRILREGVVDHDHHTGEVRGVLHRGCNGAEGKVANSVGRWAGTGMDYAKIIPWLENLLAYLKRDGTGWMYPTHKTPEEKALAVKLKRKTQRANTAARAKVRSMKAKEV